MGWLLVIAVCATGCGRLGFSDATRDATTDATTDANERDAMPGACDPPRKLCDGFESLDARWTADTGVSIDPTRAHRGGASLRVHAEPVAVGDTSFAAIRETTVLPQDDSTLHVRVWMLLDELPMNNMGIVEAIENDPFPNVIGVFVLEDAMTVYSQFDESSWETSGPPALSTWLCLQWTIVRSQTNGSLVLAGDAGTSTLENIQTEGADGLHELMLGIAFAGTVVTVPQPAMDIWFDDLIVSTAPITCQE